jgi:exodeoxyribonuclease VII large subunit
LSEAGGALRPSLLAQRISRDQSRLQSIRLRPELVTQAIARHRERLESTWRLALSLDPRRPLAKGFALVTAGDKVIMSAGDARAAGAMRLTFQDGSLEVSATNGVETAPAKRLSSPPKRKERPVRSGLSGVAQQDLFAADEKKDS